MDDQLLTVDGLAEYLNISRRTMYRLLKAESLPAYRVGKQLRFRREDVDDWLQKRQVRKAVEAG